MRKPITTSEIQSALFYKYDKGSSIIAFNTRNVLPHEADVLVVRPSGVIIEFEVKVSTADFLADFKKKAKHEMLRTGNRSGPQRFYYACPPGVIPLHKLPNYAGLVHVKPHPDGNGIGIVTIIEEAPRLHSEIDETIYKRLCRSLMYRRLQELD